MTLRERFEDFIFVEPGGCWLWAGGLNCGYGMFHMNGHTRQAHRVSYELYVGVIPEGLQLDHLCRETRCVNWRHLQPVTVKENLLRSLKTSSGQTHCKRGHELTGYNCVINSRSSNKTRLCRECHNARSRAMRGLHRSAST